MGPNLINFPSWGQKRQEEEITDIQSMRGFALTAGGRGGAHGKHEEECECPPRSKDRPQLTASKESGPQSYHHKEVNPAHNLNELGSRFICRASRKECSPANTLILTL